LKRIVVSVTNDLVTDQRVHRICTTLSQNNYEIILIGRQFSNSKTLQRKYKTHRFKLLFNKGALFYAEYNIRLFFKLLSSKPTILLANDLDTLFANFIASSILNKKLVYDSHELFTEVPELIHRPFIQNIWLTIEKFIIPKLKNCYTVSDSIAKYYFKKYGTQFSIIKNVPYSKNKIISKPFPFKFRKEKIIIYQGAINKGRGLELMIETMLFLKHSILVIIGSGDIENKIKTKILKLNLEKKVKFMGRVTPNELQKLTPSADLGISLEENIGLNYRFALPNKLFDYIQAKIPVLVSNLPEIKKIVEKYNVGEIILSRKPKSIANQINSLLKKRDGFYDKSLQIAQKELNWENESKKLIKIYKNLK